MKLYGQNALIKIVAENFLLFFSLSTVLLVFIAGQLIENFDFIIFAPVYIFVTGLVFYYLFYVSTKYKNTSKKIKVILSIVTLIPLLIFWVLFSISKFDLGGCEDRGGSWDNQFQLCLGLKVEKILDKARFSEARIFSETLFTIQKSYYDTDKKYSQDPNAFAFSPPKNLWFYSDKKLLPEFYLNKLSKDDLPFVSDDKFQILIIQKFDDCRGFVWKIDNEHSFKRVW